MRDDVVADSVVARGDGGVERVAVPRGEAALGIGLREVQRGGDHDMQRRRLERFDEALRQPGGEAVAVPASLHPADFHLQLSRRHVLADSGGSAQLDLGLRVGDMAARIDVAIARPRGQRDRPAPARAHCLGLGLRA